MRPGRIGIAVAALSVAVAAGVAQAGAGSTIGSSLTPDGTPGSQVCDRAGGCTVSQTSLPGRAVTAPSDGTLTRWQALNFRGGVSLKVIRGTGSDSRVVGTSPDESLSGARSDLAINPPIPVREGDRIGAQVYQGGAYGFVFNANARTDAWDPALGTSPTAPTSDDLNQSELLLSATFVPAGSGGGTDTGDTGARTTVAIGAPRSLERVTARSRRVILFAFRVRNRGNANARGVRTCVSLPRGFRFNYTRSGNRPPRSTISGRTICIRDAEIPPASDEGYVVMANTPRAGRYRVRISVRGSNFSTRRRNVSVRVNRR